MPPNVTGPAEQPVPPPFTLPTDAVASASAFKIKITNRICYQYRSVVFCS